MGQFVPTLRGGRSMRRTEQKSIAGSAYSAFFSDVARRGLAIRGGETWPIERAITEGYERVIWVFRSVSTLAADSSGLPFRLRQGQDVLDDHPLYRVLNGKANELESGEILRKRLSAQVLLSRKGAFVQKRMSNRGTVKELHLLPPDRVEIIPGLMRSGFEETYTPFNALGRPTKNSLVDHYRLTLHGGGYKNFEPDEVMWFRDPHPTDPYSGMTPLEAAGMSVELDHFARMYNVAFMQNDGRPGGVLAVRATDGSTGDVDPAAMDRIEKRFGKGPVEAGKLSVIAGELSYTDLATRPRDMQYGQTSSNSKMELLAAFGMSEVVLGNAAGRTFDNADAELYNYWTRTIPAHNRILLTGFDEDSGDDLVGFFDTSEVEVLERQNRARREEARVEVEKGLRSIKSYADLAGYGDEIEDNLYTRSLYVANGKTPVPTRAGDDALLGLDSATPSVSEEPPAAPGAIETPPGVDTPALAAAPATEVSEPGTVQGVDMQALQAPSGVKSLHAIEGGGARPKATYALSRKDDGWQTAEPSAQAQQRLEADLVAALTPLVERWVERAAVRVGSQKMVKGTRHWQSQFDGDLRGGTKALDAARAVDEETWQREAEEHVSPILTTAAVAAALVLLAELDITPPTGETLREMAVRVVRDIVGDIVRLIGRSAARQARALIGLVNDADQDGESSVAAIRRMVRERLEPMKGWAEGVSVVAATGTVNGARDAAAVEAETIDEFLEVRREWFSRRDDRVRPTHVVADGQSRGMREPFIVGGALLRFPGDPLAPPRETANCRCRLRHRHRRSGRFVSIPIGSAI